MKTIDPLENLKGITETKSVRYFKRLADEFKVFILRGNVLDLAIAVLLGASFQSIVNSLVQDLISPILGVFGGLDFSKYVFKINDVEFKYGSFITSVINFLITSLIIFLLMKLVTKIISLGKKDTEEEPKTKKCIYCFSEIHIDASRCPNCTSLIPEPEPKPETEPEPELAHDAPPSSSAKHQ